MEKGFIKEKKPRSEKQLANDLKCRERMQEFHKNKQLKNEPVTVAPVEDVKIIEKTIKPKAKKVLKIKNKLEEEQPNQNIEVVF